MRLPRKESSTDIYHIMIQGVNKRILFEDDEDNITFINILKLVKEKYIYELYAYCLMGNHVHLMIKAKKDDMAQIMKSIEIRYNNWFHKKYDYTGPLYNGRYKSKEVETQSYFQKLMSYIHNNPVKAGICKSAEDYIYSSISQYKSIENCFVDVTKGLEYFGASNVNELLEYLKKESDFVCLEVKEKPFTDMEAIAKIREILSIFNVFEYNELRDKTLKLVIKKIKKIGITAAQLRRFTGLPFGIIKKQWQIA